MVIKKMNRKEVEEALPLVWRVFTEYEAVNYSDDGKEAFRRAIYSEEYISSITAYGAYEKSEVVGIIATRNKGAHLALFFVDGNHHRKGIGRRLWEEVFDESKSEEITVNSSMYAVPVYEKLGFSVVGEMQENGGIVYIPMKYARPEKV